MDEEQQTNSPSLEQNAEEFGSLPNDSAPFGTLPHDAESVGKMPRGSESFRSVPQASERKENHSLTVREVARLFENAGVARSERSIVNWCQPNRHGICRLDCYFDPNERKYYITPQSAEAAIAEEKARAISKTPQPQEASEPFRTVPQASEKGQEKRFGGSESEPDGGRTQELQREVMDLKIANRAKDFVIEQMQKERTGFFDQLLQASHKVGELETELRQLGDGKRGTAS